MGGMVGPGTMGWVCEARARSVVVRPEATRLALIRVGEQSVEIPRREAKSATSGVARPAVRFSPWCSGGRRRVAVPGASLLAFLLVWCFAVELSSPLVTLFFFSVLSPPWDFQLLHTRAHWGFVPVVWPSLF